jgi:urea transport system permease protein
MVSLSEFGAIFAMQGFNGLSVFCVLLLMALGLAIIFGQMGVINMAHGEFMTIGAYITYLLSHLTTTAPACSRSTSSWPSCSFAVALAWAGWPSGADPPPLQAPARHAAGHLGPVAGDAADLPFHLRRQGSQRHLPDWLMGSFKPTEAIDIPSTACS